MKKTEITTIREALGLTIPQLAKRLGVERADIAGWGDGYKPTKAVKIKAEALRDGTWTATPAPDRFAPRYAMADDGRPLCISAADYTAWCKIGGACAPTKDEFCQGCTVDFQSKNIQGGTCGNPGLIFGEDDDGHHTGTRAYRRAVS